MIIYRNLEDIERDERNVLTAGTFDGLHRGHCFILDSLKDFAARRQGVPTVVTFEPHPQLVLARPDRPPIQILTTIDQKIERIRRQGIEKLVIIPFTREFSQLTSEEYVTKILYERIGMQGIVIGYDHGFGRGREGGIHTLQALGAQCGFWVEQLPPFKVDGEVISATRIRNALKTGDIEHANMLLGYAYTVQGTVVKGDGRGRQLGFPTANIELVNIHQLLPANGVYVAAARLGSRLYRGMANVGRRPTFNGAHVTLEIHLFDFSETVYGESIEVSFFHRLRDERKFESVHALVSQLHQDRDASIRYFATHAVDSSH